MLCNICGNEVENRNFKVREMMFGTQENFDYFECANCGCLQIAKTPIDMPKYYPHYYFRQGYQEKKSLKDDTKSWMLRINRFSKKRIFRKHVLGVFEQPFIRNLVLSQNVDYRSQILEVGCGDGGLLVIMSNLGFSRLVGVDPYSEQKNNAVIRVIKATLDEICLKEKIDIIIFNHSLEHIADQLLTLGTVSKLLSKTGLCQIRIPLKTRNIWNRYGTSWVQLDAPRHFFLHTVKSLQILARHAGLKIEKVSFDSTEFQFWGSEQYKQNIPLRAANSYWINPKKSIFSQKQIKIYSRMARKLNRSCQGDQATFYLTKASDAANPS